MGVEKAGCDDAALENEDDICFFFSEDCCMTLPNRDALLALLSLWFVFVDKAVTAGLLPPPRVRVLLREVVAVLVLLL